MVVIVAAEVVGTAFVGRLFILVETRLMSLPWFVRGLGWQHATHDHGMASLRSSVFWKE
jgi:hypothetical protein